MIDIEQPAHLVVDLYLLVQYHAHDKPQSFSEVMFHKFEDGNAVRCRNIRGKGKVALHCWRAFGIPRVVGRYKRESLLLICQLRLELNPLIDARRQKVLP